MFKTIYRIFFILLAAALIAGALYLFFTIPAGQALVRAGRGGGFDGGPRFNPSASASLFNPGSAAGFQRDFGGRDFRGGAFSPLALFDLVKNAATIGLITLGVVLLQRAFSAGRMFFRRRSLRTNPSN